ncbi:MAG: DNA polymerase III subunit delta' C-terminal domain-containing protein [Pseudomonadota bacterium]
MVEEKLGKGKEFSLTIASLARGSSNRACELAEGATLEYRNRLINQISALSPNSVDDTFKLAEEMAKEKDGLIGTLEVLKTWFRDLVIVKENCPTDRLINIDLEEEIERLEKKFTVMDLLEKIRIIDDAESALLRNSNKRLTLEVMLARLSQ